MTHKERFLATIERKPVDKPASWLGLPVKEALKPLFEFFNVSSLDELRKKVDDDIYPVEIPYNSPVSNDITSALKFTKKGSIGQHERTLTAPGFFEGYSDPERINDFDWPDPEKYIDIAQCKKVVDDAPHDRAVLGVLWSCHFQDACSAFGMETALVKMFTEPEMFRAVIDRITEFYLKANGIFFEATKGKLDAVLIGNDFGSQLNLMVSPASLREFVFPGTRRLVEQAHSYGLKVIHHSCGCIYDVIPDLINLGVDAIHPIQALAYNMEPWRLQREFGDKVSFCGGVDAQELLVNGSSREVEEKVRELIGLFPTGLIISPSHEAILPDTRPENIKAIFDTIKDCFTMV